MPPHDPDSRADFADLNAKSAEAVGFSDSSLLNTALPQTVQISVFETQKSKTCITKTLSLSDLIAHVAVHKLGDKEGTSWSPTRFLNGRRSSENAATCQLAVLDIDHNAPAPQLLASRMKALGIGGAIVSTHSHTIEETRLRVVIFSEPWVASNFDSLEVAKRAFHEGLKSLAKTLDVEADVASMEPARLFYDPRNKLGSHTVSLLVDGAQADVWPPPHKKNYEDNNFSDDAFEEKTRPDISRVDFERMVMHVKNDSRFGRKTWLAMIAGIKDQLGDEGCDLAEKWSSSWTGGEHDPEEFAKAWRSLKPNKIGGATAETVRRFAIRDGWVDADGGSDHDRFAVYGDLWNGRQFAHDHRDRLLYVESSGIWYMKQGPRFIPSSAAEVDRAAKATSKRLLEQAFAKVASDPSDTTKKQMNKAIGLQTSLPAIRKMIDAAKSEPGMSIASPDCFDQDPFALLVENGVLDLKTGTLRKPHAGELFAKKAGTNFDRPATCTKFMAFLKQVQPNESDRA